MKGSRKGCLYRYIDNPQRIPNICKQVDLLITAIKLRTYTHSYNYMIHIIDVLKYFRRSVHPEKEKIMIIITKQKLRSASDMIKYTSGHYKGHSVIQIIK